MVLLQTSTSQKNILLILRDRTDQTVVENWRPSRKKTILFVTSAFLTDVRNFALPRVAWGCEK